MNKNYTVYHLHTELSLLDSCTNYKLYVDKAVELGQNAIAFTEHGNVYNWVEKKLYCNAKGLKYIHGVECYLTCSLEEKVRDNYHTILLAKNYDGVKEINTLMGIATQEDHFYYKPRLTFEEFLNISDNVIKISACLASPLNQFPNDITGRIEDKVKELTLQRDEQIRALIKKSEDKKAEEAWIKSFDNADYYHSVPWAWQCEPHEAYLKMIKEEIELISKRYDKQISELNNSDKYKEFYYKLCKAYDFYEIQPHVHSLEQIKYNKALYMMSQQFNIPLIVGTDTHSINDYKAECRSILQKAKGIIFTNEDEYDLTYKSYDEVVEMFKQQGSLPMNVIYEALENTNRMADMVEDFELDTSFKYPKLYDNEEEVLKQRIVKMLQEKIDNGIIDKKRVNEYKANIVEELKVFKKIDMVGFMLFMSELVCWCWDNDIPIGFCRGSVGGSTIAYITGIIDVDPVVWKTVFSRFANEDRKEIGDIDIDISPSQRHLVYQHIIESFGLDNTAYILAIGTISDKGTIDEIGRALSRKWDNYNNKLPFDDDNQMNEIVDIFKKLEETCNHKRLNEIKNATENPYSLDIIAKIKKDFEVDPDGVKAQYPDIFYYFDGLNGTAISQSMHPAGIIVSPITLPDNYGTFWSDGKRILYINMEECHEISLVKYDLLGLKNIEIIHKCCKYAGIPYPKSHEINWNDKRVWENIIKSPVGIFQFEGDYAFSLLESYVPTCVNDLSLVNAALRPSGASYRDRLLARQPNRNPSKMIDNLLADNNGYLVFQEDTIKFLKDICGLSGSDADNVRRAIGRKQLDRLQKALPQILEGYCKMSPQPREVAEEEAKAFLQIIEDSSNYQFGYNHSTGYSMIGYTCAYMRYYYPEEFIAAYLNCANNSDDIINGTALAKQLGVAMKSIRFGHSDATYAVDKDNHALYKGIESIKFCNAQIAHELKELSKNRYTNFVDLLADIKTKTSVNSRQLNILIGLNFFSDFGKNQYLLNINEMYDKFATCKQVKKDKMESLGLTEYLMKKYAGKETEKQYRDIDNQGLITELSSRLENKPMSVVQQVKFEKDYLEYVIYNNPKVHESYYIVVDYKHYKDASKPYFILHNIKTGEEIKSRIKQGKIFKADPFGLYSILKIKDFAWYNKTKMINGEWQKVEDLEPVLESYEVIK